MRKPLFIIFLISFVWITISMAACLFLRNAYHTSASQLPSPAIQPDYRLLPVYETRPVYYEPDLLLFALRGDPAARLRYAEGVNYYVLPDRFVEPLARERVEYLRSGQLDKTSVFLAYTQLKRLHGSKTARNFALALATDKDQPREQRWRGLEIIGGCLNAGSLGDRKPVTPTSKEVRVFRQFLRSKESADQLAAIAAIQVSGASELTADLHEVYAGASSPHVRCAIMESFGWMHDTSAFPLALRASFSSDVALHDSAAQCLVLFAAEPKTLSKLQITLLRNRLEQFEHGVGYKKEGKEGIDFLIQAGFYNASSSSR